MFEGSVADLGGSIGDFVAPGAASGAELIIKFFDLFTAITDISGSL